MNRLRETGVKKIYLLDYGWLSGEEGWFIPNPAIYPEKDVVKPTEWVEIPVPGALIEHEDGLILLDTGSHPDAKNVWPEQAWNVFPMTRFSDENRLENQLKLIGYKPEDVTFLVFTHLHLDHAGQAYLFSDTETMVVAHKKELMYALYMTWIGKPGAYVEQDLESLKGAKWHTFDTDQFELLPGIDLMLVGGHTPGSIIMRVTTKAGNTYIFTGDFIHLPEELEIEAKGWLLSDADEYYTSIRKLKLMLKTSRTHLVISHDPKLWEKYPKAPKYLE